MHPDQVVVGMDWADEEHAICLLDLSANTKEFGSVAQKPEAIAEWVASLRQRFPNRQIVVCLEQSRGALIYCLMKYESLTLVPVNPKQLAKFREALGPSGRKDDPTDAELIAELCAKHGDRLRAWKPDTEETRLLTLLSEDRRSLVDQRTALTNRLKSRLKQYFPQALRMFTSLTSHTACVILQRWPSLQNLQQVSEKELRDVCREYHCYRRKQIAEWLQIIDNSVPLTVDRAIVESHELLVPSIARQIAELNNTIKEYDAQIAALFCLHEDHAIFASFPGAGEAMGPRLLTAFGTDRERFTNVTEVQSLSGIAPVTKRSGKTTVVLRRWACNKFLRQTFHEYAGHSIKFSSWAKAYHTMFMTRCESHQAAIRSLAYKWIRILYRCWINRTPYDESKYLAALRARNSPIIKYLETEGS